MKIKYMTVSIFAPNKIVQKLAHAHLFQICSHLTEWAHCQLQGWQRTIIYLPKKTGVFMNAHIV